MQIIAANINANGTIAQNNSADPNSTITVNKVMPGTYDVSFTAFGQVPSIALNVINWDAETSANTINIGLVPQTNSFRVEFWRNNNYSDQSFSFIAVGL